MYFLIQFWEYVATHWREILMVVRNIFSVINLVLIVGIAACWYLAWRFRPPYTYQPYSTKRQKVVGSKVFERRWKKVTRRLLDGTSDSLRLAVIEADKLADDVLKSMQLKGEHIADRLQHLSSDDLKSLDGLWQAHRTRNDVVHTPGFTLSGEEAQKTLRQYEAFFREVEVLPSEEEQKKAKEEKAKAEKEKQEKEKAAAEKAEREKEEEARAEKAKERAAPGAENRKEEDLGEW